MASAAGGDEDEYRRWVRAFKAVDRKIRRLCDAASEPDLNQEEIDHLMNQISYYRGIVYNMRRARPQYNERFMQEDDDGPTSDADTIPLVSDSDNDDADAGATGAPAGVGEF